MLLEDSRLLFPIIVVNIEGPITPVAADASFVILAAAPIARLDRVALAQAASPAPSRAARIIPRAAAAAGLLYVFLEDARLLLAVVVCVNRTS